MRRKRTSQALLQRVGDYLELLHRMHRQQDTETIHDFRVASRNLLALFPLFPRHGDAKLWKRKVRHRLHELNRLRDLQVLQARLDKGSALVRKEIDDELSHVDIAGSKRARRRLEKQLLHSTRRLLRSIDRHPHAFESRLREEWFRIHRLLSRRLRAADSKQPATLHKLRVAYKAFRYITEFLADAGELPDLDKREVRYWQDILGEIQDYRVASAWLDDHPGSRTPKSGKMVEKGVRLRRGFIRRRRRFRTFIDRVVW